MSSKALSRACAMLCVTASMAAYAQQVNPFDGDDNAIRAGEAYYASRCTDCHGGDAKGSAGPDLTALWQKGTSDGAIFQTIRNGIEESIMVPSAAPDDENWAIIAYLKSISTVPPFEVAGGDAVRGREIFSMECAGCHSVNGDGGHLGPDLSVIAEVRSRESLSSSIREPSAIVPLGFRAVTLVTGAGERIRGAAKAEDAFSIQLVDTNQRLQGYFKSSLIEIIRESESLMPEFGRAQLGRQAFDDLLAYLATLRVDDSSPDE